MASVKILFFVTVILIILAAVALVALAQTENIFEAIEDGDMDTVRLLLERDPGLIEIPDDSGNTPLHFAVAYGQPDIARFLIEKGAPIDAQNQEEFTPLRYASVRNQHEAARALLEAGADTEIPDDYGRTPLLICARETGDVEMARLLLDHGANVNAKDRFEDTPIVLSAWRGFEDQVNLFLDRGAETPIDGDCGAPLVEYSVKKGLPRLFAVLEANGADFMETTDTGWSKLHSAALGGSAEITGTLIERGLDINAQDMYGYAPVHYAAKRGRNEVIQLLVSKGAFTEVVTVAGETPWNIAESWHHDEAAGILADAGAPTTPPQFPELKGKYLGQKPPGMVPEVFAPGIASTCDGEHGCVTFSPAGDEAYWSTSFMLKDTGYSSGSIMGTKIEDGKWTKPRFTPFSKTDEYNGDVPFFAPDGETLYFISRRPIEGEGERGHERIWYARREGNGWSVPQLVEGKHGAMDIHWQFAVTDDGTIYFGARGGDSRGMGDIYVIKLVGDTYGDPVNLGEPVCTEASEGSPYVSPDGSMLLFSCHGRDDSVGGSDIYICRRKEDGTWSEPVNPGETINSGTHEQCPMLSPDGKYLFFISQKSQTSDIYWVDAKVLNGS